MAASSRSPATFMLQDPDCYTIDLIHHSNLSPWLGPQSNSMTTTNHTDSQSGVQEAMHYQPEYDYSFHNDPDWDAWPYRFLSDMAQYSSNDACALPGNTDGPSLLLSDVLDNQNSKSESADFNQYTQPTSLLPPLIGDSSSVFGDTDSSLVSHNVGDATISRPQSLFASPNATNFETPDPLSLGQSPIISTSEGNPIHMLTQPHHIINSERLSLDGFQDQDDGHNSESSYPPVPPLLETTDNLGVGLNRFFYPFSHSHYVEGYEHRAAACQCVGHDTHDDAACDVSLRGGYLGVTQHTYPSVQSKRARPTRSTNTFRDPNKDDLLLRCKASGMSYKDIKILGGFTEAESTLRGRYRTLTKPKEARVRKPGWTDRDVTLLKQIVNQHLRAKAGSPMAAPPRSSRNRNKDQHSGLSRIPWKQVADQMANQGCYRFGNATVKKKYMDVMGLDRRDWE